jgi:RHS repeat-associated protein
MSQIAFKQVTTNRMTTTKQYDHLNRLTAIQTLNSQPSTINSYNYQLTAANQRIRSTLADGSYWLYEYDSLGQVRSGHKFWADQTPVAGQQFEYAHDDIGNRTQTKAGGDQNGANLRTASYGANSLNQYTNRQVPGAVDVMGISFATNGVSVNSQAAYRKGEYFRAEVPVSNGSVPVWQSVTVVATNQATVSGNVFVPRTPEQFYYDADGNLTSDGRWQYTWDAENRLVGLTTNTTVGPRQSMKFEYDWQGRRIHKQVWANAGWSGTPTNDVKFVYASWNPLAELNGTNNAVIQSYVWGSDLSGSIQGGVGVGGLLFICDLPSAIGYSAPAYDGNGNVMAVVSMSGGTNCAAYEYGPFGEVIRMTGPMAKANPFRFSTKYQDDETDLLYYGLRYYSASTGRWISKDPAQERGGNNLYACLNNNLISKVDKLGLWWFCNNCKPNEVRILKTEWEITPQGWSREKAEQWDQLVKAFEGMEKGAKILELAEGNPTIIYPTPNLEKSKLFADVLRLEPVTAWAHIKYKVCVNQGKRFWWWGSDQWDWQERYYPSYKEWSSKDYETGLDAEEDATAWVDAMYVAIKTDYPDQ